MSDYRIFVVPYDFSNHAKAALFTATDLARRFSADLHLVHVVQPPAYAYYGYGTPGESAGPPPTIMDDVRANATKALREVVDGVESPPGRLEPHVVEGSRIADMIVEAARALEADLIVMGTHGRTGLAHVFLGSIAERTLRSAPCPVLTVRAPEATD